MSAGFKRDGTRRELSGTAYSMGEAEKLRVKLAIEAGYANAGDDMTLDTYFSDYFIPGRIKRGLAQATINRYTQVYDKHISPKFGLRGMNSIKHAEIQRLVDSKTHATAKQIVSTLRAVLRSAWDDGLVDEEPMRHRMRYPKNRRKQLPVWTVRDVCAALPVMRGSSIEALWLCMLGGGLRRQEAYALFGRDLKFAAVDSIHGGKVYTCYATVDDAVTVADGRKCVKTDFSERIAAIPEPFASRLLELDIAPDAPICAISLDRVRKQWHSMWEAPPTREDGTPWRFADESVKRGAMLEVGVPYVTLPRMRATHETLLQSAGVSDTLNARIHGRSDVSGVGYTNYLNPHTEAFTIASDALSALIAKASNS